MKMTAKLLTPILTLLIASCASTGVPIASYPHPTKALLVLDMQKDFIGPEARMPIEKGASAPLIDAVNRVSASAAKAGMLVIYIRNEFPGSDIANLFRNHAAEKGTAGAEIDPRVTMVSDSVFDKDQPDAFSNPKLEEFLISHQVNELVVTGVFADQCCYFTSVAALNRKYKVTYLTDGVGAASAENIKNASTSLRDKGASITTTDKWTM